MLYLFTGIKNLKSLLSLVIICIVILGFLLLRLQVEKLSSIFLVVQAA